MTSQDDHHQELEQRERILREREVELRLREMESDIHTPNAPFQKTVKHQPHNLQKPWVKKTDSGGKIICFWCHCIGSCENSLSSSRNYDYCCVGVDILQALFGIKTKSSLIMGKFS
ncbi:hypothetical protein [Nostoc sp. CCY0012]|uniref:hypothetical protein n=1 Tax=Nostoc sp. CCY0012 TaxID=1056123 RepID=UPI0039C5B5A1